MVGAAEMALASARGIEIYGDCAGSVPLHAWLFGEDQGRYLIATEDAGAVLAVAAAAGVSAQRIGAVGGDDLRLADFSLSLTKLRDSHEKWLPNFMAGV